MTACSSLHRLRPLRLAAALSLGALALPALAQDPPTRAGRIAYTAGAVSFSPAGTDAWAQAPLNRPLVAGDRLWTEPGARDEAQFGPAIARMDGGTLMQVRAADEGATQLQLAQGRIDLHVRRITPGETIEIDTPNLAFVPRAPGDYRIVVAPDGGSTDVAALRGAGEVYGDDNAYHLGPGQGYRFAGQDLQDLGAVPIQPYDDFDRWAFARDQRLDHAQAARFVPADVVGYEDLDDNGAWRKVPDYGTVWVPTRVAADWAPYHSGHWAWIDPWGWTWIDDQPWGYAVSHYGRWANIEGRWAWVPSPPRERPVYAPALVAFVGAALALGASSGGGPGVGWFPLGPREAYRPPYHASPAYLSRVNVSNTPFRPGMLEHELRDAGATRYANRGVPGALMAMPASQFAQAAPVARAARVLPPQLALRAPVTMAPVARPLPQSRIGTPPARQRPPAPVLQRIAVAHGLPHGLATPGVRPAGQALAQHGAAPLRMLRPAPAVRPGVPPPQAAGGPRLAGRFERRPQAAAGMAHPPAPGVPQLAGRPGMPAMRAGAPVGLPAMAAAAPHAPPGHPEPMRAQRMDAVHAPAPHASAPAPHMPAHAQLVEAAHPAAPHAQPHAQPHVQPHAQQLAHAAPPQHVQPPPHVQPPHVQPPHQQPPRTARAEAAPHPQPTPHPQPAPHAQAPQHPQPPPHPPAAAPHPEAAHAPPPGKGGGHEGGKEHEHGH